MINHFLYFMLSLVPAVCWGTKVTARRSTIFQSQGLDPDSWHTLCLQNDASVQSTWYHVWYSQQSPKLFATVSIHIIITLDYEFSFDWYFKRQVLQNWYYRSHRPSNILLPKDVPDKVTHVQQPWAIRPWSTACAHMDITWSKISKGLILPCHSATD